MAERPRAQRELTPARRPITQLQRDRLAALSGLEAEALADTSVA